MKKKTEKKNNKYCTTISCGNCGEMTQVLIEKGSTVVRYKFEIKCRNCECYLNGTNGIDPTKI